MPTLTAPLAPTPTLALALALTLAPALTPAAEAAVPRTGANELAIPLAVPPGIAGVAPSLALRYSSHAPMTVAGQGWQVGPAPIELDLRAPDPFAEPRWLLEGKGLLPGADGKLYPQQLDGTVVRSYSAGGGGTYFEVIHPDGALYEYGTTTRVEALCDKGDCTTVQAFLDRVTEAHGLSMQYLWNTADINFPVLSEIRYAFAGDKYEGPARRVVFDYQQLFPGEGWHRYNRGVLQRQAKVLRAVETWVDSERVRRYELTHEVAPNGTRLLTRIEEVGLGQANGTGRTIASFDYSEGGQVWADWEFVEANFFHEGRFQRGDEENLLQDLRDFDGDGIPDVASSDLIPGTLTVWASRVDDGVDQAGEWPAMVMSDDVLLNSITDGDLETVGKPVSDPEREYSYSAVVADFRDLNGDGWLDYVYWDPPTRPTAGHFLRGGRLMVRLRTDMSEWGPARACNFTDGHLGREHIHGDWRAVLSKSAHATAGLVEVTGDGMLDYVRVVKTFGGSTRWEVWRNRGESFGTVNFAAPEYWDAPADELALTGTQGWSSGEEFGWSLADTERMLLDFNGDGIPDFIDANAPGAPECVTEWGQPLSSPCHWKVWYGTGRGFEEGPWVNTGLWDIISQWQNRYFGDLRDDTGGLPLRRSVNQACADEPYDPDDNLCWGGRWLLEGSMPGPLQLSDVDGDGLPDLLASWVIYNESSEAWSTEAYVAFNQAGQSFGDFELASIPVDPAAAQISGDNPSVVPAALAGPSHRRGDLLIGRWQDMDGDGLADYAYADSTRGIEGYFRRVDSAGAPTLRPYLLTQWTNGAGGVTSYDYASSVGTTITHGDGPARSEARRPLWNLTGVRRSRRDAADVAFSYAHPILMAGSLRGYESVTELAADGSETTYQFYGLEGAEHDAGEALAGFPAEIASYAPDGSILRTTRHFYAADATDGGHQGCGPGFGDDAHWALGLTRTEHTSYGTDPSATIERVTFYERESCTGLVTQVATETDGDAVGVAYTWNRTTHPRRRFEDFYTLASTQSLLGRGASARTVSGTWEGYEYDLQGDLRMTTAHRDDRDGVHLGSGDPCAGGGSDCITTAQYERDEWGYVQSMWDAAGDYTSYSWENDYLEMTRAVDTPASSGAPHRWTYERDPHFGDVAQSRYGDGAEVLREHGRTVDAYGRLISRWQSRPDGTGTYVSEERRYFTNAGSAPGAPYVDVESFNPYGGQDMSRWSRSYLDVFGRQEQSVKDFDATGNLEVSWVDRDAMGRITRTSLPRLTRSEARDDASWSQLSYRSTAFAGDGRTITSETLNINGRPADWGQETWNVVDGEWVQAARSRHQDDPRGAITTRSNTRYRDAAGQLNRLVDPLGYITHHTYDARGRLTEVTDPAGNVVRTGYDSWSRPISREDPDQGVCDKGEDCAWTYTYSDGGRLRSRTDAQGITLDYAWDELGRLISRTGGCESEPGGCPPGEGTSTYTYDGADDPTPGMDWEWTQLGTRTRVDDPSGYSVFGHDRWGRTDAQTREIEGETFTTSLELDLWGRERSISVAGGRTTFDPLLYHYDDVGQLLRVEDENSGLSWVDGIERDAQTGLVTRVSSGHGAFVRHFGYGADRRMLSRVTDVHIGSINAQARRAIYLHDQAGRFGYRNDQLKRRQDIHYYDALDRLVRTQGLGSGAVNRIWEYDGIGNLTYSSYQAEEYGLGARADGIYGYHKDLAHAVTSIGDHTTFEYDAGGLMTRKLREWPGGPPTDRVYLYGADRGLRGTHELVSDRAVELGLDAGGAVVRKTVTDPEAGDHETLFPNSYLELRDGQPVKIVWAMGERLAETSAARVEDAPVRWFFADHQGSDAWVDVEMSPRPGQMGYVAHGILRREASGLVALQDGDDADRGFGGGLALDTDLVLSGGRLYDADLGRYLQSGASPAGSAALGVSPAAAPGAGTVGGGAPMVAATPMLLPSFHRDRMTATLANPMLAAELSLPHAHQMAQQISALRAFDMLEGQMGIMEGMMGAAQERMKVGILPAIGAAAVRCAASPGCRGAVTVASGVAASWIANQLPNLGDGDDDSGSESGHEPSGGEIVVTDGEGRTTILTPEENEGEIVVTSGDGQVTVITPQENPEEENTEDDDPGGATPEDWEREDAEREKAPPSKSPPKGGAKGKGKNGIIMPDIWWIAAATDYSAEAMIHRSVHIGNPIVGDYSAEGMVHRSVYIGNPMVTNYDGSDTGPPRYQSLSQEFGHTFSTFGGLEDLDQRAVTENLDLFVEFLEVPLQPQEWGVLDFPGFWDF